MVQTFLQSISFRLCEGIYEPCELGSKKGIEIFKYLKYIVLAITSVKIFEI